MVLGGVGAEYDDGDVAGAGVGTQPAQHFFARDVGQVQVEQDQVGTVFAGEVEGRSRRAWPG